MGFWKKKWVGSVNLFFFLLGHNDDVEIRLELHLKHLIGCQRVLQTRESVIKIASDHKIMDTNLNWPVILCVNQFIFKAWRVLVKLAEDWHYRVFGLSKLGIPHAVIWVHVACLSVCHFFVSRTWKQLTPFCSQHKMSFSFCWHTYIFPNYLGDKCVCSASIASEYRYLTENGCVSDTQHLVCLLPSTSRPWQV